MAGLGNIFTFTLTVVAVVFTYAAVTHNPTTTRMPSTTKEVNEYDGYNFFYIPGSHRLYVKHDETINKRRHRTCWIVQLSDQETQAVHTSFGMRVLEVKVLAKLSSAVEVPPEDVTYHDKRTCRTPRNGTLSVFMIPL